MRTAALLLLLAAAAPPALAQRELAITRFDGAITVRRDATIDVRETITARFTGSWNGIFRTIPVEYRTLQGFRWTIGLDLQGATDEAGTALRVEASRAGHLMKYRIWVPGAQDTTRTITLHYVARNALRFFDDHDELYWNVTGDEWDVPIGAASATIELPAGAAGVRATAFTGAYGSTAQDAEVAVEGTRVTIRREQPLGFREGVTAVVGWSKGLVDEPTKAERAAEFAGDNWPIGLPVLVFAGMFALWRRVGRDPEARPVTVRYEPPPLTPAEAGALVDESVDQRDITATLVDLAVKGWLRIEEKRQKKLFGLFTDEDYAFVRLDPPAGAAPLLLHEQRLLDGIFASGGTEVLLSDLEQKFYTHLPGIRNAVFDRLVELKLYRSRPDRVKERWFVGAAVLCAVLLLAGISVGVQKLHLSPIAVGVAALGSALVVAAFGQVMPARTYGGARTLEQLRGFEEFLGRVEGDRYERVVRTPELFEKYLPFAMAFGVERRWAKAFEDILREPPRWYGGSNLAAFNASSFSGRLSDLSSRAASTMTSAPRSSGGSGFGGGGRSGGGGGGGGGGGF